MSDDMISGTKNGKGLWTIPGTFYRTRKGSKAHASSFCANQRRSIFTGDIVLIPAEKLADWSGCQHCCDTADMAYLAATKTIPAVAACSNSGVTKPGRFVSTCRDCGKEGKVNRATGRIRAHKPVNVS